MISKIFYITTAVLAFGVAGYAIFGYLILEPGSTVTPAMQLVYQSHKLPIVLHALFASIALAIGVPQFNKSFRDRYPKLNVIFRNIYFVSVVIAAVTGFVLAFTAQGGLVNTFGFGILAILWLLTTFKSINALQKNDFSAFRIWIVRNYTLTFAAVTLRIYLGVFFATLGYEQFDTFYPTLGFLCWVPNVVFTEWFLFPYLQAKKRDNVK